MYQVLYRKWRPQTFSDVYGQPHVTAALKNELRTGRLAHAYLFTGSRGTGKTSCAKILAKAVNCQSPVDGAISVMYAGGSTTDRLPMWWRSTLPPTTG